MTPLASEACCRCPLTRQEPADERDERNRDDDPDDEFEQRRREDQPCHDERDDADRDGEQHPHRILARVEEPPERADDGAYDDEPDPVHGHRVPRAPVHETRPHASANASSSRRSSLISSRSFAAYSKRSSSAATSISSSSVIASFSSSSRVMPSTSAPFPPRRRFPGTCGCSSWRNSAMSDTPFLIC